VNIAKVVVEAEDAEKAVRVTVVAEAAGVKAALEVRVDQAVQADAHAASVNIFARRKSASSAWRRWT
jgi:hypothetical protein